MIFARVVAILACWLMLSGQSTPQLDLETEFDKGVLILSANENACFVFDVYIAASRAQQMQGLMFVRELPEMTGMLFAYREARVLSMWMKNTFIPLDILFVRADGTVSSIAYELGFSNASDFGRAFKKWSGQPPSSLRQPG